MALLKKLFGDRGKGNLTPAQENPPESTAPEKETTASPQTRPAVTVDTLTNSIEVCKSSLENCNLSEEEIEKYASALTTMEQAIRGLHAVVDVTDLMDTLNQVFTQSLLLILSHGLPMQRDKAIKTINDAIKAIPSPVENPVKIATLQLAILIHTALIISSNETIAELNIEKEEYLEAEKELLKSSSAESPSALSEIERITFDQYEQQINQIKEQINGAKRLITTYNQEIVSLKGIIRNINLNPMSFNIQELQEKMRRLREKMPGIAVYTNMVKYATQNAEKIREKTKAEIRKLKETMLETAYIPDAETEQALQQRFAEVKGEQAVQPVQETENTQTEQPEEEQETLTE